MANEIVSMAEFQKAIKNFSVMSLEMEPLVKTGSVDALRIINKSVENRNEAIEREVSRRLQSLDSIEKEKKVKELSNSNFTLETLLLEEVKQEFDKGVSELKMSMREDSHEHKSENKDEKEDSTESGEEASTEEEEDEESTEEESTEEETTDKDSSDEESTESEGSDEENTGDEDTELTTK